MSDAFRIRRVQANEASRHVEALADLLLDCVEGGASVSFMWPLPRERAIAFWSSVAEGVRGGERVLLVAQPDNQPHRADVAKMLVHRSARRRGLAQRLLVAVEQSARDEGKTVLVLDTVTGGDAERLYARGGWQPVGSIPNYALMPDGRPCATTYFHKQL
jgi:GNAT superfamily N-acetyltransferase